ncbi:hypothetical protein EAI_14876 [Harpegnathos saltator]|uniref:Uncharacterized protein n=1 Tax=Harpegnathos saltator TaxID=610380 RepID=E2BGU9_HARSA|nr:hypothetical protein EAI_14876 [Harpegnathos saltator]
MDKTVPQNSGHYFLASEKNTSHWLGARLQSESESESESENGVTDGGFMKYDPSKLEDWELGDISNCGSNGHLSAEIRSVGRSCRNGAVIGESDRSDQSRLIFGRSLSNESEPYETTIRNAGQSASSKLAKDTTDKLKKDCQDQQVKRSSRDRRAEDQSSDNPDNDHSTFTEDHSLNDEATEGSNLSSITSSLAELETPLSRTLVGWREKTSPMK